MSVLEFTIAKRCGNIYAGYLFPGTVVMLESVLVNTVTGSSRAQVWTAHTNTVSVPVGSVVGLRAALAARQVPVIEYTPSGADGTGLQVRRVEP